MKSYLHECFPSVPYFVPVFEDGREAACRTISGVFGVMLVPMLYGIEPVYREDNWPDAKGGSHLPKEEIERIISLRPSGKLRPLEELPGFVAAEGLFRQMEIIAGKAGRIPGYLNYQGIMNVALKVRGSDIFIDMFDDPEFVHAFFRHIAGTIRSISKAVQARQTASGFPVDLLSMSNCVMNMVRPEQYEEFVLPLDIELSREYGRFGIHTCNWKADPYLDSLRKIEKMGYLDTGIESDLPRIKKMFPHTRRAVLYSPVALEHNEIDTIRRDVARIARDYAPCDIVLADVENTTPVERVNQFLSLAEEYA
jgi:hypothetical protein